MNLKTLTTLILTLAVALAFSAPALAEQPKLVTVATFDIGGAVFVQITGAGKGVYDTFKTKVRPIPVGNAMARAIAVKSGSAQFWGSCSSYYAAQEGLFDFEKLEWGPQEVGVIYGANRTVNFSPFVSKKSGIKQIAELKGKKVPWIEGNGMINIQTQAYLAYGGLTLDDVELVKFPGYSAHLRAFSAGQIDMGMTTSIGTSAQQIASSPGGLHWLVFPETNKAGWDKLTAYAPFVHPVKLVEGAGCSKDSPADTGTYPCPVIVAFQTLDVDTAYWMTKMMAESWDAYQKEIPGGDAWHVSRLLDVAMPVPYHPGAIKYFKEKNMWTDKMEQHQEKLLRRQAVLKQAFADAKNQFLEENKKSSAFPEYWKDFRINALEKAGLAHF